MVPYFPAVKGCEIGVKQALRVQSRCWSIASLIVFLFCDSASLFLRHFLKASQDRIYRKGRKMPRAGHHDCQVPDRSGEQKFL